MTHSITAKTLALAFAVGVAGSAASAYTLNFTALDTTDLGAITPMANPLADSTTGTVLENVVGNQFDPGLVARTPWEDSTNEHTGEYTSVQANSSGTWTFDTTMDTLNLIWGSPDDYNDLTITLSGGGFSETINGADVQGPVAILASAVSITDVFFDTVKIESGANAFEFANLEVAPVPLPAAGWMLLAGLGGLGAVARRRRKAA
jgi:hypothetical protein